MSWVLICCCGNGITSLNSSHWQWAASAIAFLTYSCKLNSTCTPSCKLYKKVLFCRSLHKRSLNPCSPRKGNFELTPRRSVHKLRSSESAHLALEVSVVKKCVTPGSLEVGFPGASRLKSFLPHGCTFHNHHPKLGQRKA